MLWLPPPGGNSETAADAAVTSGISVTTPGVINTKGAWTELLASTARDTRGVLIQWVVEDEDTILDIGIGAAASEVVIAENLFLTGHRFSNVHNLYLPLSIPEGTRVAARYQATGIAPSITRRLCVQFMEYGWPGFPGSDVFGIGHDLTDSGGTVVDPGGTANTKGSWTQLTASLDRDIWGFYVSVGSRLNAAMTGAGWLFDVGMGAAASEVAILENVLEFSSTTKDENMGAIFGPYFIPIAEGERISMRCQCSITDATDRLLDYALIGFAK